MSENCNSEAVEVSLEVSSKTKTRKPKATVILPKVYGLETFSSLSGSVSCKADMTQWNHLKDLNIEKCQGVSILIGQDVSPALMPHEVRRGKDDEPYAIRPVRCQTIQRMLTRCAISFVRVRTLSQA